eukprot:5536686-Pyramimonas_sp.AAC.1
MPMKPDFCSITGIRQCTVNRATAESLVELCSRAALLGACEKRFLKREETARKIRFFHFASSFRGPSSSARPSSDLSMREKNGPGDSGSVYTRTRSVALLDLQLRETDSASEDHSYFTNSTL